MKKISSFTRLFFLTFFLLNVDHIQAHQKITITSSRANNYCNGKCTLFDVRDLNGNPYAIVFVTPIEVKGKADKTLNTNPKTPVSIMPECNCVIPTSLSPNGSAGDDLSGSFPYPKVTGLAGKPLSSDPSSPGQVDEDHNFKEFTTQEKGGRMIVLINTAYFNMQLPRYAPQFMISYWRSENNSPSQNFKKQFEENFSVEKLKAMVDK